MDKPILFSAIQPSGIMTLGNYIGAIKNWVRMQYDYECYFCIADLHTITVKQSSNELYNNTLNLTAIFIAAGIEEKQVIFIQSHVSAHAQLAWILNCHASLGELSRMTQFKDKSSKNANITNAGLFTYPVLMAADILLYHTNVVPVGEDQKQHVELSRNIAHRFNSIYGDVFSIPTPVIAKDGARIMSLQNPAQKMSKSDLNNNSYISILDTEDTIVQKIRRAVTDSEGRVVCTEGKSGVHNLMNIYSSMTEKGMDSIEKEFDGLGYRVFKDAVAQSIIDHIKPVQRRFYELIEDKDYLQKIYQAGAQKATKVSCKTLDQVREKLGFLSKF